MMLPFRGAVSPPLDDDAEPRSEHAAPITEIVGCLLEAPVTGRWYRFCLLLQASKFLGVLELAALTLSE